MKRKILEMTKQIYLELPKDKDTVLAQTIDLAEIEKLGLLDKVVKPWVSTRIKQLLGVEEQNIIRMVMTHLKSVGVTP